MIRTVITPKQQNIQIQVPETYLGKKVEVIAFTIDEATAMQPATDKPLTYLASEQVLAKDWLTPEEDNAWQHL